MLIKEMQQHAKTCTTAAQDSTEEALTGESSLKERNQQEAKEWMIKAEAWLEAEALVRGMIQPAKRVQRAIIPAAQATAPCI